MKKYITIILLLFLTFRLSGQGIDQDHDSTHRSWQQKQDTIPENQNPRDKYNFNKKPDIYGDWKRNPEIERWKNLPMDPAWKSLQDSLAEKKFPGSSRFYGKSLGPSAYRSGHGNSFIVKPDTIGKQYLLIMDPLTGKVTKSSP